MNEWILVFRTVTPCWFHFLSPFSSFIFVPLSPAFFSCSFHYENPFFSPVFLSFLYSLHIFISFPPKHDVTEEKQQKKTVLPVTLFECFLWVCLHSNRVRARIKAWQLCFPYWSCERARNSSDVAVFEDACSSRKIAKPKQQVVKLLTMICRSCCSLNSYGITEKYKYIK